MIQSPLPQEDTALKRVPFVDRRRVLREIEAQMTRGGAARGPVFFVSGPGGIGKTEVLKEILRRCRAGECHSRPWFAASDVIDFYHLETHSLEGLAAAIDRVLKPGPQFLINFRRRLQEFHDLRWGLAGLQQEITRVQNEMGATLIQDLNAMARHRQVVLAFDTAERLMYEPDEVQAPLGINMEETGVEVLPWFLRSFLSQLENIVVLLAARPEPETPPRLRQDLLACLKRRLVEVKLPPFELDDTEEYWEAAAINANERGAGDVSTRIRRVNHGMREVIWRYTAGRPIILSLVIDYVTRADLLLDDLKLPVGVVESMQGLEMEAAQKRLEARMVREFQERGLPADPAIKMLGWARRGLNVELLARLLETPLEEAEPLFDTLRDLAFTKVRPENQHLFLHDEMYKLLWEHVLKHDEFGQRRAFATIVSYYEEAIKGVRAELAKSERPEAKAEPGAGPSDLTTTTNDQRREQERLSGLMAEQVYYALRHNPAEGFRTYYRYLKESYWAGDSRTAMELRDELLLFYREFEDWVSPGSPLSRHDVVCECALRWIDRANRQAKYEMAVAVAERLREDTTLQGSFATAGLLAQAELDLLEGRARIYAGRDSVRGQSLLEQARLTADGFDPGSDTFAQWRKRMLLAETLNDLGYAARVQGLLKGSEKLYSEAILRWRLLGKEADSQHANTLNNLSWALAERGAYNDALRRCLDGLGLRRALGFEASVALSLNTLGLIEVRNDQPHRGQAHCRQALDIFRKFDQPRGIGLACIALSEALRRTALAPEMYPVGRQAEMLKEAAALADEAVAIFAQEAREKVRLVEALIELGCVYREWMRIRETAAYVGTRDLSPGQMVERSERAFRGAIDEACADMPHKMLDAQVNLAWLYYYTKEEGKARDLLTEAMATDAVRPYLICPGKKPPKRDLPQPVFWMHLGKAHLLLGRLAMRKYDDVRKDNGERWRSSKDTGRLSADRPLLVLDMLDDAAEQFLLALEYDRLYADDFRDLRRGQERIYDELKGFNLDFEFPAFVTSMERAEAKYTLTHPTLLESFLTEAFGPMELLKTGAL